MDYSIKLILAENRFQLLKIAGINRAILEQALKQAHDGRMFILGKMLEAIPQVREELSQYAPRVITMNINPDKIRDVIGPGGKVIKKIVEETGVKIDIEDDGRVMIMSSDGFTSGCVWRYLVMYARNIWMLVS